MLFKRVKVVMLPTNEKAKKGDLMLQGETLIKASYNSDWANAQHLYILSDEKIKEGDWVLYHEDKISQVLGINIDELKLDRGGIWKSSCKKIIAATDTTLTTCQCGKTDYHKISCKITCNLPQPSQSFIEKFIEEYNKGNVITEVMVEYETITKRYGSCSIGEGVTMNVEQLKVSKDNTITIKKVKDSWNRKEVIELMEKAFYTDCRVWKNKYQDWEEVDFSEWIEENL